MTESQRDARRGDTEQILSGIRIVELGTDVAAAYAARLCAIYGADVITVEPPEGHPVRHLPSWVGGSKDPAKSILFAYLGMGKRSVCLDMSEPDDNDRINSLILSANGVFDSYPPGRLANLGIDLDNLSDMKQALSVIHISPYGQTGPRADWTASTLTAAAAGRPTLPDRRRRPAANAHRRSPGVLPNRNPGLRRDVDQPVRGRSVRNR